MSCNLAGSPGSCRPVPDGVKGRDQDCPASDPATCAQDGTCNGKGACRLYPARTPCATGVCTGESFTGGKACDGNGQCVAAQDDPCYPYSCAGPTACRSSCTRDTDCATDVACGPDGKCGPLPTGRGPCSTGADCLSKNCFDGVCCNTDCSGPCVSCNLPESLGKCVPLGKGLVDPTCARAPVSTCGLSGACAGDGSCAFYDQGTVWTAGTCSGTIATTPGTCSGDGARLMPAQKDCAPALCGSSDCIVMCKSDNDCVSPKKCDLTTGKCGPGAMGASCTDGSECQSTHCVDHVCCESACQGKCMTCALPTAPGQCKPVPAGGDDPTGTCSDMGPTSCGTDSKCDGKGDCRTYTDGTPCAPETCVDGAHTPQATCSGGACIAPRGGTCDPFRCNGSQCFSICTQNSQCSTNNTCVKGSCGLKAFGSLCNQPSECQHAPDNNQYCAQGVCCTTACDGPCQACSLNGQGLCTAVPDGARDPQAKCATLAASTCGTTGKCAAGACQTFGTTQQCKAPTCVPGSNNDLQAAYCGGKGLACPMQISVSCGVYACDAATGLCKSKCTSSLDCTMNKVCLPNGTCGQAQNGARCISDAQCLSGACAEGYCCNTRCSSLGTGTCMSCSLPGHEGTCTPVPLGGTDPGGRCTPTARTTCGLSGTCDGTGKCADWDPSTVCSAQICASGTLTSSATCDGGGKCTAAIPRSCGNYTCNGNVCRTTCTPATGATDCAPGITCNSTGNTCGTVSPNGTKCLVDKECASGACVQGTGVDKICCATACPADSASAPSCFTGMCVATGAGAGLCAQKGAGAACGAPGSCAGSKATSPRACNAAGTCGAAVVSTCPAADLCHSASTCTGGVCSAASNLADGTPCNDNTVCDGAETCVGGVCTSGVGLTCASTNPCQMASCDPVKGCVTTSVVDGTGCNDGKSCTVGDKCTGGTCAGTVSCDDGNPCTADACGQDGTCTHMPVMNGSGCSDGNACNGSETCQAGACTAGTPVTCTAKDACHPAGICDKSTGACSSPLAPVGTPCDDGNLCTTGETCGATGTCGGGTATVCLAPANACHLVGVCTPATGICSTLVAAKGAPCEDGNKCTMGDTCDGAGACTAGTSVVCPTDACHLPGTCEPATGCSAPPGNDGATCDGPTCVGSGICMAGTCMCPP